MFRRGLILAACVLPLLATAGAGGRTWSHVRFTVTDYVTGLSAAHVSATTAYLLVHTVRNQSWDLRRTDDSGRTWRVVRVWRTH